MRIIGENGDYQYVGPTRTVATSDHPVFQARIELALPKGQWPFAKNRGHQLEKYKREDQTQSSVESYQKELLLYLDKYGPEVIKLIGSRGVLDMSLSINKDALNV